MLTLIIESVLLSAYLDALRRYQDVEIRPYDDYDTWLGRFTATRAPFKAAERDLIDHITRCGPVETEFHTADVVNGKVVVERRVGRASA